MIELLNNLLRRYPRLRSCRDDIHIACGKLIAALEDGHTLFLCGNGGSAADSEHIAGELMKSYLMPRPLDADLKQRLLTEFADDGRYLAEKLQQGLKVISLTGHYSLATAMANDVAADLVFAQQLMALGEKGDILLAISTSGNSVNVCHAVRVANALDLVSIGLSGESGGLLSRLCETVIKVPEKETYLIQELHLPVYHFLCASLERHFFSGNSTNENILI